MYMCIYLERRKNHQGFICKTTINSVLHIILYYICIRGIVNTQNGSLNFSGFVCSMHGNGNFDNYFPVFGVSFISIIFLKLGNLFRKLCFYFINNLILWIICYKVLYKKLVELQVFKLHKNNSFKNKLCFWIIFFY